MVVVPWEAEAELVEPAAVPAKALLGFRRRWESAIRMLRQCTVPELAEWSLEARQRQAVLVVVAFR